jgi:hypothetical protein
VDEPTKKLELLNTEAAAKYLQLSERTLEDYRVTGGGPAFIRAGRGRRAPVLYLLDDLNAWLLERRVVK